MWYIFRHGETFKNRNNIKQGHSKNSFLTFEGVLQAHMNGLKLKNLEEDFSNYKFLCSPLERTYHTCQLIIESLGLDVEPIVENAILSRERGKVGIYKEKDIEKFFPEEGKKIKENIWGYKFEGYESYKDLYLRLAGFIKKYENEKNLVMVSHKGLNRNLMYLIEKNNEIKNLVEWIENLTDEEGNKLVNDLKNKVKSFDQNYFYSWDGKEFVKI